MMPSLPNSPIIFTRILSRATGKVSHQGHLGMEYRLRDRRRGFRGRRSPRHRVGRVAGAVLQRVAREL